jgi:hypothetical protein
MLWCGGKTKLLLECREHPSPSWNAGKTKPYLGYGANSKFSKMMPDGYSLGYSCHGKRKFNPHAEGRQNEDYIHTYIHIYYIPWIHKLVR